MADLIIRNGKAVLPDGVFPKDILVGNGTITGLAEPGSCDPAGAETVDAEGLLVFPGMIDTHVHFNDPGYTWRETFLAASMAAAAGGVTTVMDMPLQNEPTVTNGEILKEKAAYLKGKSYVDYALYGGVTDTNLDDLEGECDAGAVALKVFLGPVSPDYRTLTPIQALKSLERVADKKVRMCFHAEDYRTIKALEQYISEHDPDPGWREFLDSRPVSAELAMVDAVIEMTEHTGAPVHISHVSHPLVAEHIRQAQKRGLDITAETCGHYLSLTEDDLLERGALLKCAPPLRRKEDVEALWDYVFNGTFCSVASDHSPCRADEKEGTVFEAWGGISGVQSTFQVVFDRAVNRFGKSPAEVARVLSEGPAKAFRLYGKKGALLPGFDADLVLVDPERKWTITPESLKYLNPISAFTGMKGKGMPVATFVRGKIVLPDEDEKRAGEWVRPL